MFRWLKYVISWNLLLKRDTHTPVSLYRYTPLNYFLYRVNVLKCLTLIVKLAMCPDLKISKITHQHVIFLRTLYPYSLKWWIFIIAASIESRVLPKNHFVLVTFQTSLAVSCDKNGAALFWLQIENCHGRNGDDTNYPTNSKLVFHREQHL